MIFSDIIALAKAGYSPADVKDLIALTDKEPEIEDKKEEPEDKDKIIEDLKRQIEENEKALSPEPEPEPEPEDPKDKEIEELKQKLAAFQKEEVKKDISGKEQKTDNDIVNDLVRNFM